jgi:tubulin---tyrosine ligase
VFAIVEYPEPYVQPLILDALQSHLINLPVELISSIRQLPSQDSPFLQFAAYESLDFEHALSHPKSSLVSAYVIRKALIRKHYLSNTISTWLIKYPDSRLKNHFKASVHFELDYAEFLDDALVDAWDLKESMARNERLGNDFQKKECWILKPGMSDGGNGIRLFSSMEQLQNIFEEWDGDDDEDVDENEEDEANEDTRHSEPTKGVMTSQLRHFVAQPYIDPPLLLPCRGNRKFHIRAYVLAVGALKVYVHKEMLALFAAQQYQPPSKLEDAEEADLASHLTNTCFQDDSTKGGSVMRFWDGDFDNPNEHPNWKHEIHHQICMITGEVFEAAAREQMVHFQVLPNAFEIFGVDFLVDEDLCVWLLELNAYPDFKQTGEKLQDVIVGGLFREVARTAIGPFFSGEDAAPYGDGSGEIHLVRDIDLGRR